MDIISTWSDTTRWVCWNSCCFSLAANWQLKRSNKNFSKWNWYLVGVDEKLIDSEYYAAPDVMKWFLNQYPNIPPDKKPIECVLEAGEVIFVPSGWWHQVLNLETSICVTQNFCSTRNFRYVFSGIWYIVNIWWLEKDMLDRSSKQLRMVFAKEVNKRHPELFKKFFPR